MRLVVAPLFARLGASRRAEAGRFNRTSSRQFQLSFKYRF
jgi:hypothetical protein